jgi:hypothetical protein
MARRGIRWGLAGSAAAAAAAAVVMVAAAGAAAGAVGAAVGAAAAQGVDVAVCVCDVRAAPRAAVRYRRCASSSLTTLPPLLMVTRRCQCLCRAHGTAQHTMHEKARQRRPRTGQTDGERSDEQCARHGQYQVTYDEAARAEGAGIITECRPSPLFDFVTACGASLSVAVLSAVWQRFSPQAVRCHIVNSHFWGSRQPDHHLYTHALLYD